MNSAFIFSSVGSPLDLSYKKSVLESWNIDRFDSGCAIFNSDNTFPYDNYFKICIHSINYKFPNFFYFNSLYNITNKYKYIAILDDDLLFNTEQSLNQAISIMIKYNLSLCSLSNNNKQKPSPYNIMAANHNTKVLFITNFCEMGCMIFNASLLNLVEQEYNNKISNLKDWGFDWWICSLASLYKHKIGIIKYLSFSNPYQKDRELGIDNWLKYENNIKPIKSKVYSIYHVKD